MGIAVRPLLLVDVGGVVCRFDAARRLAVLAGLSGQPIAEVRTRLFESGFDAACDRGEYPLADQCAGICERLGVQASPLRLAEWWAAAFTPDQSVVEVLVQARSAAHLVTLTNNGPLVHLMLRQVLPQVSSVFDELRFSYQVGATKPTHGCSS
jgi:FMN phosphatase YigB (HAD superfamily)